MDSENANAGEKGYSFFDDEPNWRSACATVAWFAGRIALFAMAMSVLMLAASVFFQAVAKPLLEARGWI